MLCKSNIHITVLEVVIVELWLVQDLLFGLAIDFVMKIAVDKDNRGLTLTPRRSSRYPAEKLADLDYADDIALFEASEAAMAVTTEAIRNIAGKLGLQMSHKKTDILPIGSATTSNPIVPLGEER